MGSASRIELSVTVDQFLKFKSEAAEKEKSLSKTKSNLRRRENLLGFVFVFESPNCFIDNFMNVLIIVVWKTMEQIKAERKRNKENSTAHRINNIVVRLKIDVRFVEEVPA